jgi:hypothetical protein
MMEGYLEYYGYDVEKAYKNPYTALANGPSTANDIKVHEENNRVKFIMNNSLSHLELVKVMNLKTIKEV